MGYGGWCRPGRGTRGMGPGAVFPLVFAVFGQKTLILAVFGLKNTDFGLKSLVLALKSLVLALKSLVLAEIGPKITGFG